MLQPAQQGLWQQKLSSWLHFTESPPRKALRGGVSVCVSVCVDLYSTLWCHVSRRPLAGKLLTHKQLHVSLPLLILLLPCSQVARECQAFLERQEPQGPLGIPATWLVWKETSAQKGWQVWKGILVLLALLASEASLAPQESEWVHTWGNIGASVLAFSFSASGVHPLKFCWTMAVQR